MASRRVVWLRGRVDEDWQAWMRLCDANGQKETWDGGDGKGPIKKFNDWVSPVPIGKSKVGKDSGWARL